MSNVKLKKIMRIFLFPFTIALALFGCQSNTEESESGTPAKPLISSQNWESKGDQGWYSSQKIEFKYDENDLPIEETEFKMQGDSTVQNFRTVKSYDQEGKMVRTIRERWINKSWIFAIRSAYIYNGGKIIQRIDSVAGSNAPITFISYRYDDKDRLETELGLRSVEGNMVNQSSVIYRYDDRDLPIEKQYPRWSDNSWTNSRKMDLVYNEAGHHTQTIRYNWSDEQWVERISYLFQADDSGTRLSEVWRRSGENGPEEFTRVTYAYR